MATERRRNKFASDHDYHTAKHLSEKLMTIGMNKVNVKINKPQYLGFVDSIQKYYIYSIGMIM